MHPRDLACFAFDGHRILRKDRGRVEEGAVMGGAVSLGANNRSAYSETDFHQLEENRFAAEAAEMLKTRALEGGFESLVIVAPPKTLGELRKHYHKEVAARLLAEVDKDLTGHTVPAIEQVLSSVEPANQTAG